jgi:hypothetical protein
MTQSQKNQLVAFIGGFAGAGLFALLVYLMTGHPPQFWLVLTAFLVAGAAASYSFAHQSKKG